MNLKAGPGQGADSNPYPVWRSPDLVFRFTRHDLDKNRQDEDFSLLYFSGMPVGASRIPTTTTTHAEEYIMLNIIAIILIILWLLGLVTSTTMGGFIHVLLVIAVIVILVRLIQGRKIL